MSHSYSKEYKLTDKGYDNPRKFVAHYNSDFSGDVELVHVSQHPTHMPEPLQQMTIPADFLLELVGNYIRMKRISRLESAGPIPILTGRII